MTAELWIHLAEAVVVVLIIPIMRGLVSVMVGLRDATRDLKNATENLYKQFQDHENRLRNIEMRRGQ